MVERHCCDSHCSVHRIWPSSCGWGIFRPLVNPWPLLLTTFGAPHRAQHSHNTYSQTRVHWRGPVDGKYWGDWVKSKGKWEKIILCNTDSVAFITSQAQLNVKSQCSGFFIAISRMPSRTLTHNFARHTTTSSLIHVFTQNTLKWGAIAWENCKSVKAHTCNLFCFWHHPTMLPTSGKICETNRWIFYGYSMKIIFSIFSFIKWRIYFLFQPFTFVHQTKNARQFVFMRKGQ